MGSMEFIYLVERVIDVVNITEQMITALAPNQNAVKNGKKISQNGSFVKLSKSEDESLYMGECAGSGKKNYFTSADFIDENKPVFRCNCPSRQFPCKHSIGLLFEILENKSFEIDDIPEDIIKKREKIKIKNGDFSLDDLSEEEKEKFIKKRQRAKKASNTARIKKAKTNLEGFVIVEKTINDIVSTGIASANDDTVNNLKKVSKELGNYYLYGPQKLFNNLERHLNDYIRKQSDESLEAIFNTIKKISFVTKKSKDYLNKKIESGDMSFDDNEMYEQIGNTWKSSELKEAGCVLANGDFSQLAFYVTTDFVAREYVDTSVYLEHSSGNIYITKNIRPFKLGKKAKEENSILGVVTASDVVYYPASVGNKRVRWEGFSIREYVDDDYKTIMSYASESINDILKEVKNTLKHPLADKMYLKLVAFSNFAKTQDGSYVLVDKQGGKIILDDMQGLDKTCNVIELIPDNKYIHDNVALLGFYENKEKHRIQATPFSIIVKDRIIRLMY